MSEWNGLTSPPPRPHRHQPPQHQRKIKTQFGCWNRTQWSSFGGTMWQSFVFGSSTLSFPHCCKSPSTSQLNPRAQDTLTALDSCTWLKQLQQLAGMTLALCCNWYLTISLEQYLWHWYDQYEPQLHHTPALSHSTCSALSCLVSIAGSDNLSGVRERVKKSPACVTGQCRLTTLRLYCKIECKLTELSLVVVWKAVMGLKN